MMRGFSLVLVVISALLLVGCGNGDSKPVLKTHGAKSLEEADADFYRIQASYEMVDTGEKIEFDYMVSAYNRDVIGSYSGVIFPEVMFKKTSDGGAIAIEAPSHYHLVIWGLTLPNMAYELIPALAWYPDSNNLQFAHSYVSSDAYLNPKAKVKILDYKATKSNRESFYAWLASAKKAREEEDSFPWAMGCGWKEQCEYSDAVHKVDVDLPIPVGKFAMPRPLYVAVISNWPEGTLESYKEMRAFTKRYYCANIDLVEPLRDPGVVRSRLSDAEEEELSKLIKINNAINAARRSQAGERVGSGPYRDLPTAKGETDKIKTLYSYDRNTRETSSRLRNITKVYPVIRHPHTLELDYRTAGTRVMQVLMEEDWLGYGLPSRQPIGDFSSDFEGITYLGERKSALYFNNELICETPHSRSGFAVYDMKLGRSIYIGRAK